MVGLTFLLACVLGASANGKQCDASDKQCDATETLDPSPGVLASGLVQLKRLTQKIDKSLVAMPSVDGSTWSVTAKSDYGSLGDQTFSPENVVDKDGTTHWFSYGDSKSADCSGDRTMPQWLEFSADSPIWVSGIEFGGGWHPVRAWSLEDASGATLSSGNGAGPFTLNATSSTSFKFTMHDSQDDRNLVGMSMFEFKQAWTVTAKSNYGIAPGFNPQNVVDGRSTTYWYSYGDSESADRSGDPSMPQWLVFSPTSPVCTSGIEFEGGWHPVQTWSLEDASGKHVSSGTGSGSFTFSRACSTSFKFTMHDSADGRNLVGLSTFRFQQA